MTSTIKILSNLISIPSLSSDGDACKKIMALAQSVLLEQQIPMKFIQSLGKPVLLWGDTNLEKTRWLINTHLDIVPGEPEQFKPFVKNGKLWGRGSADTKGSCAVLLSQASTWNQIARKKQITFMLVCDEEIGGDSTRQILSSMKNLHGAIFLEPTGLKINTQAKGMMQIKIVSRGQSVHGSRPWEGNNAIEKLMLNLIKFRLANPQHTQTTKQTSFNFSLIKGGTAINQVPEFAELWCDVRFNPTDDIEQIIQILKESFSDCEIFIIKNESPINCDLESQIFTTLSKAFKQNSINPLTIFEHGTSDARHCTSLGIPALVFGPKGYNLHAKEEWVTLKSLETLTNILGSWINII